MGRCELSPRSSNYYSVCSRREERSEYHTPRSAIPPRNTKRTSRRLVVCHNTTAENRTNHAGSYQPTESLLSNRSLGQCSEGMPGGSLTSFAETDTSTETRQFNEQQGDANFATTDCFSDAFESQRLTSYRLRIDATRAAAVGLVPIPNLFLDRAPPHH